jgi:DNA repair exonuclease SbcCD ATPase subunit
MSKINGNVIELKNFFSYGNQWQTIELHEGLNVVLGHDNDKERSNGSGKTSFLEAIPFALFGATGKGVPLNKIINWSNGKQCEVRFHFEKNGIQYELHRGIKPGLLELVRDGVKVPKLSDKRMFQQELENDIIGMDFRASQAIHFQNANNMISMFDTPKADKRKFIEKFFNLEIYSKMNEHVNGKLRGLEQKRSELDAEKTFKERRIAELEMEINGCTMPDIASYEHSVTTAESNLNAYRTDYSDFLIDPTELEQTIKKGEQLMESKQVELDKLNGELKSMELTRAGSAQRMQDASDRISAIGDLTVQREKLDKLKAGLEQIGDLTAEADEARKEIENLQTRITTLKEVQAECNTKMKIAGDNLNEWKGKAVLDGGECPTCFQEADPEHIKGHIDEKCKIHTEEIDDAQKAVEEGARLLYNLNEELTVAKEKLQKAEDRNAKKVVIEKKITELSNITEKEAEVVKLRESIKDCEGIIENLAGNINSYLVDIGKLDEEIKVIHDEVGEAYKTVDRINKVTAEEKILVEKIESEKKILESQKEIADRIQGEQQARIASRDQMTQELTQWGDKYKKLDMMQDYLKYIKESLKDENVKQYAISNIVPFLQAQMNRYLSETGHSYYVELDNWLEGTIKGFGVGDSDFGNMSGGEGKSIDLSLKFAMMDVARRQAGSYLDVLVLDELLDSSIDSFGLEKTVDIIKMKQAEDKLKVFVVSHREEIGMFDFDRAYNVVKENGFSSISVS